MPTTNLDVSYRELFESNPHPMWVFDIETLAFLAVNDSAIARYGWSRDEFLAMSIRDIRPAHEVPALDAATSARVATTTSRGRVWQHLTKAGELILVEIASHDFPFMSRPARLVLAYDVTHREAARASEERFRLVARATTDAIWDWDLVADTIWYNEGMVAFFGELRSMAGRRVREEWKARIHPDDVERVLAHLEVAVRGTGETWNDEYRFLRLDGGWSTVSNRGFLIRAADGAPLRLVGGMTDLTERRHLEAQALRAQRMESIGTLAGGMAHDLNNMLAPVLMSVELLREHVSSALGLGILDTIEQSTKRGADLVRQVLAFARGVDGQRAPLAIAKLAAEHAQLVLDTFPKSIALEVDVPDGIWVVVGDHTQMQQVLVNLLVNARDAMPEGGTIRLAASNVVIGEKDAAAIPEARAGRFVRVSVADTGHGISQRVIDRMFEPFFTTKDVGKGTGLGLSTVQAIVRGHGGFVTVTSAPDEGSTFEVYLPASERPLRPSPPGLRSPERGTGQLVLIADDEPSIRVFATRLLERAGYRVLSAEGGAEALTLFAAHAAEIELVITDMQMPGTDGRAVIRGVRRIAPDTPVIAMSGLDAHDAGIDGAGSSAAVLHLLKPFTASELDGVVHRALATRIAP